jgi:hypothetical protein
MKLLTDQPADKRFVTSVLALCALSGVFTSAWCLYIDDVINNDGVEYIRAAQHLASGDWAGTLASHHWPFFSLLMLLFGKLLGISYYWAGQLLNAGFFTASSVLFVLVVRAFGGTSQRLTVFAALVAVIHPAFNEYRAFIIRDAGYLVFYLAAILYLARCVNESAWRYRIGVVVAFAIAGLFRIEGTVFLLSTPLLLSFIRSTSVQKPWLRLLLLIISTGLVAVVLGWWLLVPSVGIEPVAAFSAPLDLVANAWQQISASVAHKITVLRKEFLGPYAAQYAWILFGFSVVMILVSAAFSQLTVPWALLVFTGLWSGVCFPHKALNRLWASLIGMHLAILTVFAVVKLFLAARYPLALSMTALLLVPFALEHVLAAIRWHRLKTTARVLAVLLLLWGVGESISGLDNTTRARAIKDAGVWLADHTNTAGSLVSNDRRLAYYAGRHADRDYIIEDVAKILHGLRDGRWPDASYVALRLSRRSDKTESWVVEALGKAPVRVFDRETGDRVLVYLRP